MSGVRGLSGVSALALVEVESRLAKDYVTIQYLETGSVSALETTKRQETAVHLPAQVS